MGSDRSAVLQTYLDDVVLCKHLKVEALRQPKLGILGMGRQRTVRASASASASDNASDRVLL